MRGRKPTPTAVRTLRGNPGKRPLNHEEPRPPDPQFDTVPPELAEDATATKQWARLAPMLRDCKQITDADRDSLIAVCLEWSRYLDATRRVRTSGMVVASPSGYPIQNPYISIAKGALAACCRLWAELGLTPSSRSRVRVEGSGPGPEGDAFSEFDNPPTLPEGQRPH